MGASGSHSAMGQESGRGLQALACPRWRGLARNVPNALADSAAKYHAKVAALALDRCRALLADGFAR